nr:lysophospholipid acyltransferase family protein [Nocardioides perillae]
MTYPPIIAAAKTSFRLLGQRFQMTGTEHVPRRGGVLLACNHIGYVDFVYGGLAANPSGRKVRFMAKREIFDHRIGGPVMRSLHHIEVDRGEGLASFRTAVDYLRRGEAVGIFPEATISRSFELKEFKTGAVRIAAEAGVPLVPVVMWGTQRMLTKGHPKDFSRGKTIALTVGEPLHPTGADPVAETAELRSAMARMLDETIAAYPADEQPPGSWWLPARLGGSAPTPEEAHELDLAEKRERAARRAAKRAAGQQPTTDLSAGE